MLNWKRVMFVVLILVVGLFWFMSRMTAVAGVANSTHRLSDRVPYGEPGGYAVGMQDVLIEGRLPATIWYPAAAVDSTRATVSYPYEIKLMSGSAGVQLGSFSGSAIEAVPFNTTNAPYPLIVMSPGFAMTGKTYGWLTEHLASYGFVVIAPEHDETLDPSWLWRATVTRPQDVKAVLAWGKAETEPNGLFAGLFDVERTAVVGHSYGGYTALAAGGARLHMRDFTQICQQAIETDDPILFLCDALLPKLAEIMALAGLESEPTGPWPKWGDERVQAVVSLAGDAAMFSQAGLAEIAVPVMAIGGTADNDSPYPWTTQMVYESASSPRKVQIGLDGGEHMIFTGRCEMARRVLAIVPYSFCTDPAWEKSEAHPLTAHFITAFLLTELSRDRVAGDYLTPLAVDFDQIQYEAVGY